MNEYNALVFVTQLETRYLSDEGSRNDGINPYPLFSAIDRTLFDKLPKDEKNEKKKELKEIGDTHKHTLFVFLCISLLYTRTHTYLRF